LALTASRTPGDGKKQAKAEVINYEEVDAGEALKEMTVDAVLMLDAVGLEAHGVGLEDFMTRQSKTAAGN